MARKKKEQERAKTFSEMEAERRNRESGREAGGSRPASMSFSEMEQYRRNQQDKAIISYVKDRYRDTADPEAARQVIRTRAARNEAESMLDSYAKGYQQFGTNLRRKANGWQPNAAGTAESAKAETKRALERAGEIRSYLRNNRETLGNKTGEYEAYLDQYVRNYGADARDAAAWARDVESAGSEKEYEKETALKAGDMKAVVWENLLREAEQGKTDEQGITSGIQRAAEAWRGAKAQGDEASAAEAWKNLQEQYAKRNTLTQRAKELSTLTGVSGGYEEQIAEIKKRIAENKEETGKYFEDEIEKLEKEYAKLAAYSGQYETEEIKKRKEEIEERLSEIGYYDTRKKSFWETALWTGVSGITSWANALAGAPDRIMETFFPGYDDPDYTGRDSDAINPFDFKAVNAATKWLANYSETRHQLSLKNKSEFSRFLSDSLQSLTPMAADMLIAYLTGGASLASEGGGLIKETTQGYQMLTNMANSPYFYSTALQEFSGKFDEEVEKGVDPTTAGLAATLNGVLNAAIEIGFGIEDIAGVQELPSEIAEKMAGKADRTKVQLLVDWVKDAVSEGNEEVAQKFVGDILSRIAESPTATDVPANVLNTYSNGAEDWAEYGKAWGGGALVGGLMGAANGVKNRIAEGSREQYTPEDERITRYLEEIAREEGDTSSASLRSAPSPQGEGAGKSPRETEEVRAPQTAQETAETQRTVPEGMTEEEAERAAMTPEERAAAAREEREAEEDIRTYLEENEERAEDRSEETGATEGPYAVSGTGRIETGSAATIAGVESVKNGEMTYRLSDGNTVSAEDVKYANRGEALVAKTVAGLGVDEKGAAILLREWAPAQTGVSGETYAAGIALAYEYGLRGYPAEEVADNRDLRALRENQVRAAYELGRIERDERAARSDELLRRNAPTEARSERGGVRIAEGAVIRGENAEAQVKALDAIGKAVGVRIVVYDKEAGEAGQPAENGFYDARDRTVHINLRAGAQGDGIMLNTAAHELTHYIHDTARVEYNKLADFLFSQYGKAGVTLQGMIAEEKQAAANAGRKISDEEAMMEVVADSMETMLSDGTVIEALTRENKSLGQKIASWIGQIVEKIKRLYKNVDAETIEGRIVEDAIAEGEALRELWTKALRKAGEVGSAAETGTNEEYVSYSVKRVRAADRVSLLTEATAADVTDTKDMKTVAGFQLEAAELQAAEGEMHATEAEIKALEEAGRDQNSDRIQKLNEKRYLQSRAVEEGRYNLRKKANSKEMRAIAEKVMQNRIAETEALEEAVPREEPRQRTLSTLEERAKENAALRKSNEILKRKLAAAKEELTVRDAKSFRKDDVEKFARNLLKDYQNKNLDVAETAAELQRIGKMLIEGDADTRNDNLRKAILPLAEEIVDGAREEVRPADDIRENLASWLHGGIRIPEGYVTDLSQDFRRKNAWWLRTQKGDTVDSVYMQLHSQFGNLFPEDVIHPTDQLEKIAEVWESLSMKIEQNPFGGMEKATVESVIQDIMDGMIDEGMRLAPPTARERYEAKLGKEDQKTYQSLRNTLKVMKADKKAERADQLMKGMKQTKQLASMVERLTLRNDKIARIKSITKNVKQLERDLTGQTSHRVMEKFRAPVAELAAVMDINMPAYDAAVRKVENLTRRMKEAFDPGVRERLQTQLQEATKRRNYLERKHAAAFEILKKELGTGDVRSELRKYAERGIATPFGKFVRAYGDARTTPGLETAFDESVYQAAMSALENVGEGQTLAKLSIEQLSALDDAVTMVLHHVRNGEKLFMLDRQTTVMAEAHKGLREGEAVVEKRRKANQRDPDGLLAKAEKFLIWGNMKPIDAFERIDIRTMTDLFRNVRKGELAYAKELTADKKFKTAVAEKYHAGTWDMEEARTFKDKAGKEVSLNLGQMMALYAYSKREAAELHLEEGGFILEDGIKTVTARDKNGKKKKTYKIRDGAAHAMGPQQIAEVVGALTEEQKAYVDAMQDYLSTVMGAKGNAVTMKLHGVRQFNERNYFPLQVSDAFIDSRLESTVGEKQIKNISFSHALVPNANSAVVLEDFGAVWDRHVAQMEAYCAYVLPLEDFTKVYNYKIHASGENTGESIKSVIEEAWGKDATVYINQMLKDINGAPSEAGIGMVDKLLRGFKAAATAASLSTIVQQHTSVWRAMAYIDPKYFRPRHVMRSQVKAIHAELEAYAPVATLKQMGYFDTGTGRSGAEFLAAEEYGNVFDLAKAAVVPKNGDARMELFGLMANWEDTRTWVQIWEAAKRQAIAEAGITGARAEEIMDYKRPAAPGSKKEAILKNAGRIADEAFLRTQVYDSVFTRSQNMRKKDIGSKMMTQFMGEPTTTMNQVLSGIRDFLAGKKKQAGRKIGTAYASAIAAAVASAVIYAMRDKDEDETYIEKIVEHMTSEIMDEINPLGYFPVLRDIVSLFQGYDVTRSDMSLAQNFVKSLNGLASTSKPIGDRLMALAGDTANFFGLPVKNLWRDIQGIWRATDSIIRGEILRENPTTGAGLLRALGSGAREELPEVLQKTMPAEEKKDTLLFKAWQSGNDAEKRRWTRAYKDEETAEKAVIRMLSTGDERIGEAARARLSGDAVRYGEIMDEIASEGRFSREMAAAAEKSYEGKISSAANAAKKAYADDDMPGLNLAREELALLAGEEYAAEKVEEKIREANDEEQKESGTKGFTIYKASDVAGALDTYGAEEAAEIMEDMIEAAGGESYGDTVRRNAKSAITSRMKPKFREAAENGKTGLMEEIREKLVEVGLYGDAAAVEKVIAKWVDD